MSTTHDIFFFFGGGGATNVKRRRGRYELTIDGQRLVADTVPALEAMAARWRRISTPNDNAKPQPRKEVVLHQVPRSISPPDRPDQRHTASPPATPVAPGAVVAPPLSPHQAESARQALIAQRTIDELAELMRRAEEEDDFEAIMALLEVIDD